MNYKKDWRMDIRSAVDPNGVVGSKDKDGSWNVSQNIQPYLDQAKLDRDVQDYYGKNKTHRKMATIPNVVIVELLSKYGLDLYDQHFHNDPNNIKRLRYLLQTEYKHLLVNT